MAPPVRGDLVGTLQELHRRYGLVVDAGYGKNRAVLVFGAEANEHVLSTAADTFATPGSPSRHACTP